MVLDNTIYGSHLIMNRVINISLIIASLIYSDVSYAVSTHKEKSTNRQKRLKINPITDDDSAWTVNVETAIYRAGTFENLSAGYSTASGWDFSLSLVNIQILGPNKLFQGDTFINIAKTFDINKQFSIVVGSQNGVALLNTQPQLWFNYSYLDARYDFTPSLSLHAGSYLANAALTGTVRQVGVIAGSEITIIPHKLVIQMDYVSGHQAVSGATVNILFSLTHNCQMYTGVYVPETKSGNEFAGIIGFNLSSRDF